GEARELRRSERREGEGARRLPVRLRNFRKHLVSYGGTSVFLFGINYATTGGHGFWWCVFPILGMGLGVVKEMGGLWADGVHLRSIFTGELPSGIPGSEQAAAPAALPSSATPGPHDHILRQA